MINFHLLAILIVVGIPMYWGLWKIIFEDWDDFVECLYFWITPRWLDWIRGQLFEDTWANLKLLAFVGLCCSFVFLEYSAFSHFYPNLAKSI